MNPQCHTQHSSKARTFPLSPRTWATSTFGSFSFSSMISTFTVAAFAVFFFYKLFLPSLLCMLKIFLTDLPHSHISLCFFVLFFIPRCYSTTHADDVGSACERFGLRSLIGDDLWRQRCLVRGRWWIDKDCLRAEAKREEKNAQQWRMLCLWWGKIQRE